MVGAAAAAPSYEHLVHVFPSFGIGGIPLRMVRIINHFGRRFRHTVIALDNDFEAAAGIDAKLDVKLVPMPHPKGGALRTVVGSALALRRLRPDLLLTYNWGAIEWAMASRWSLGFRHIHFEAGFGQREADSQILRRVIFRRWALARCALVVVLIAPTGGFGAACLAITRREGGVCSQRRRRITFFSADARRAARFRSAAR